MCEVNFGIGKLQRLCLERGWRINIFTRSKGLAAYAAKIECTKITLGSWLPKMIFVHIFYITLQCKPFKRIYSL